MALAFSNANALRREIFALTEKNWLRMKLIFIWRYEQHKFEIRLGRIFLTITSNKNDILELHYIFKFSNRKTHKSTINMFVFRIHKMI